MMTFEPRLDHLSHDPLLKPEQSSRQHQPTTPTVTCSERVRDGLNTVSGLAPGYLEEGRLDQSTTFLCNHDIEDKNNSI